jgi:hypothetical protein
LKRATDKAKSICDEIMEFQRIVDYDLMYMNMKELDWKENCWIQNIGIEDCTRHVIVDKRQVLNIWGNHIMELHD